MLWDAPSNTNSRYSRNGRDGCRLLNNRLKWAPNIWMGVSIESPEHYSRGYFLEGCDAHVKFLSLEPLLFYLRHLSLDKIDWVIVGGESGAKARPCAESWIANIRNQCRDAKVPLFVKQMGTVWARQSPDRKARKGDDMSEWLKGLQITGVSKAMNAYERAVTLVRAHAAATAYWKMSCERHTARNRLSLSCR